MSPYHSPLRYPGGKTKLAAYVNALLDHNGLNGGHYVEPYAGGASIAINLIVHDRVEHVHINDLDRSVWAFWRSVLSDCDGLCALIENTPVNMDSWYTQREVQKAKMDSDSLALGFSTFFLNRTNRSGILTAGVIGGKNQTGNFKLDARYARADLIRRIRKISDRRDRITLYNLDAVQLLESVVPNLPGQTLVYLDPPYYVKGGDLYEHHYQHADHVSVAEAASRIRQHCMISYDDVPEIRHLYRDYQLVNYSLNYCAQNRYRGKEAIFLGSSLECPGLKASMKAM